MTPEIVARLRALMEKRQRGVNVGSAEERIVLSDICDSVPALLSEIEAMHAALAELVRAEKHFNYVSSLDCPGMAEFGDAADVRTAAWQTARRLVETPK